MTMHCDGFALQVTPAVLLTALLIFGQEIPPLVQANPVSLLVSSATAKHMYTWVLGEMPKQKGINAVKSYNEMGL